MGQRRQRKRASKSCSTRVVRRLQCLHCTAHQPLAASVFMRLTNGFRCARCGGASSLRDLLVEDLVTGSPFWNELSMLISDIAPLQVGAMDGFPPGSSYLPHVQCTFILSSLDAGYDFQAEYQCRIFPRVKGMSGSPEWVTDSTPRLTRTFFEPSTRLRLKPNDLGVWLAGQLGQHGQGPVPQLLEAQLEHSGFEPSARFLEWTRQRRSLNERYRSKTIFGKWFRVATPSRD